MANTKKANKYSSQRNMQNTKTKRKPRLNCDDDYDGYGDFQDGQNSNDSFWTDDEALLQVDSSSADSINKAVDEATKVLDEQDFADEHTDIKESETEREDNKGNDHSIVDPVDVGITRLNLSGDKKEEEGISNHDGDIFEEVMIDDGLTMIQDDVSDDTEDLEPYDRVIIENTNVLSKINKDDDLSLTVIDGDELYRDGDADNDKEEEKQPDNISYEEDDWDVLTAMEQLKNTDRSYSVKADTVDDWDAISSLQSVVSMDTFHTEGGAQKLSYKDMLATKSKNVVFDHNGVGHLMETKSQKPLRDVASSSNMMPIIEDDCHDEFDEREGYKYSRGGKNKLMFRGNQYEKKRSGYKVYAQSGRKTGRGFRWW